MGPNVMLVGAGFALVTTAILQAVYRIIPTPFIDEIFHIPQAQKYCNGSFYEWNDKITTPPGLYLLSLLVQLPFSLLSPKMFCSVMTLRAVNVVFNTVSLFLIYDIMNELKNSRAVDKDEKNNKEDSNGLLLIVQAVSLALFPVNYFFSFLYYTDPGSTMFVLASYLACLKSWHKTSAMLGLVSVCFRQTNIIWVFFCAGCAGVKEMVKARDFKEIEATAEIKDKLVRFLLGIVAAAVKYLLVIGNFLDILKLVWPYFCVLSLFVGFIFVNGSIVLGDKKNHEATFHATQLLYFLGHSLFFFAPVLLSVTSLKRFVGALLKNPPRFVFFTTIFAVLIIKYSTIHQFLLADNRHYTFYLCHYLLKYPTVRLLLTPVYVFAGWSMNHALKLSSTVIWRILFLVCTCMVTIPQRLIELRYFIVPYLIFRMNIHIEKFSQAVLELLFYFCINAVTLFVLFTKEVKWDDIAETQRIIW